jgi:SAM-dependent methyltransferase
MSVVDVNKEFYNRLYQRRSPPISVLYSLISFDQQSKSKANYRIIRPYLNKKTKQLNILDYGFGHGSLLLKYPRKHSLFGCDISEEAVSNFPKVAAFVGKQVSTATVDGFADAFKDINFDVITLSHIIEHVEDDVLLIKGLLRNLAADGLILINVPINEVWQDPKHVRKYDLTYMRNIASRCGLTIQSVHELDKLTSFFLIEEKVKRAGRLKLIYIKCLRAVFAILPSSITTAFEKIFLKNHKNQQLIVLASRT